MLPTVVLACPHHDADGRLYDQTRRVLPRLRQLFGGLAIHATHTTRERSLELLREAGALTRQVDVAGHLQLGLPRRGAIDLALMLDADWILCCDFDRALHWAECYPDELAAMIGRLPEHDLTVLGRTERAFFSHPRIQTDTEAIVNQVFAAVSGWSWDITAAARGLSRRAASAILTGCPDTTIGTDASWPLFLRRTGGMTIGYIVTEGLEYETPDRHQDEIAAAGGLDVWRAQLDADPRNWAQRLDMARLEVEAVVTYGTH